MSLFVPALQLVWSTLRHDSSKINAHCNHRWDIELDEAVALPENVNEAKKKCVSPWFLTSTLGEVP